MKSGPEIVKAGLRQFFESAADDIEKMVENLKLGKVSSRNQVRDSTIQYNFYTLLHCSFELIYVLCVPIGKGCIPEHQLHHRCSATSPHFTV